MTLSEKIVSLRKTHGWSQEDFAEKMDVSRQAISRWENGTALPDAQNIVHEEILVYAVEVGLEHRPLLLI